MVIDKGKSTCALDMFMPKGAPVETKTAMTHAWPTKTSSVASWRARLMAKRRADTRLTQGSSGAPRTVVDAMFGPPAEAVTEAGAAQGRRGARAY